jgi:hypothetical protein
MPCALQDWVQELTIMQQSVLMAALRGPDGIDKNHIAKKLLRWMRRCVLLSAFDKRVLDTPYEEGGGSFTGPSCAIGFEWESLMHEALDNYMLATDMVPHHFQLHFLHAAEIIGYKHPHGRIANWWSAAYVRLCRDMHLYPEPLEAMDRRLGDNEPAWRAEEEVRAD